MKLMSDLESFRDKLFILTTVFICIILCRSVQFKALLSNFKFCGITKNAGNFERDLRAKFSLNDPKK